MSSGRSPRARPSSAAGGPHPRNNACHLILRRHVSSSARSLLARLQRKLPGAPLENTCRGSAQKPSKRGALCVARRRAGRRMSQAIPHRRQPLDCTVDLVGLGGQQAPIDAEPPERTSIRSRPGRGRLPDQARSGRADRERQAQKFAASPDVRSRRSIPSPHNTARLRRSCRTASRLQQYPSFFLLTSSSLELVP
jgi:hypothetical protein